MNPDVGVPVTPITTTLGGDSSASPRTQSSGEGGQQGAGQSGGQIQGTTAGPAQGTGSAGGPGQAGGQGTAPVLSGYLSVNQALNEALIRSPRAAAVRVQLEITKALYWAATVMPDPNYFNDSGYVAEQTFRNGAQRTWDPPWKIAFRMLAAKRQVREQKLEMLNTLWGFRNDVRRAYIELVMAQETYDTLSQLAELAERLLLVSEKLLKAGSVAELDVLKARLATSQSEVDRDQGAIRVQLAKQQLNIIMGRHPDLSIYVPRLPEFRIKAEKTGLLPNLSKEVPPLNSFVDLALSNRLELRILTRQIEVAQAQLYNAYGNVIPDPQITSGRSVSNNPSVGPKLSGYFITLNIELPVFTYSQADIPRLKATIRQYHAQILSQRNQVVADVSSAYNHLIAARKKIATYQDHILADSEHVARLARRSYEVGRSDITSTLAAQQANVQVRQAYLDAVNSYQQAFTELEQAIGVPLI
jgi:cobalt-zinc-cadmium efflux system outer membrane protein